METEAEDRLNLCIVPGNEGTKNLVLHNNAFILENRCYLTLKLRINLQLKSPKIDKSVSVPRTAP